MSQRPFLPRLSITRDQRIHQIFMLVGNLIASISQDIAEVKEPLAFLKRWQDCLGQPTIARGISDGCMEQVIRLQVMELALLLNSGEACRAEFIEAAQVCGNHMSSRQLGSGWLDDEPEVEEILYVSQGDGRYLLSLPLHPAHETLLYQPRKFLATGRCTDARLTA